MIAIAIAFALSLVTDAKALSLENFLEQVKTENKDFQASSLSKTGAERRAGEANLMYWPLLEAETSYFRDELLSLAIPATLESQYRMGAALKQRTPFGFDVSGKLVFKQQDYSSFPTGDYTNASVGIGMQASLWRNLLGAETRARFQEIKNRTAAQERMAEFTAAAILADAEARYGALQVARSFVSAQKESFARAERLHSWVSRKAKVDLVTENALEQAKANLAGKKAAYYSAQDLEKETSRHFNSLRGKPGIEVEDLATKFDDQKLLKSKLPEAKAVRTDYKAQIHQAQEVAARARQAREALKPDLSASGEYNFQGQDQRSNRSGAIGDALGGGDPQYAIGLKLSIPLGLPALFNSSRGYDAEAEAQKLRVRHLEFQASEEWSTLVRQIDETRRQLVLIRDAEAAQKSRTEIEAKLYQRGRSTTFNVIQAEDDYSNALLRRLEIESKLLSLFAQMRLYSEGDPS